MARIIALKRVTTKAGKPNVLVSTGKADTWVPWGQWANKCSKNIDSYIGGDFEPIFYAKGEELLNGDTCTQAGLIVKDFVASMNPTIAAKVEYETQKAINEDMDDKAAYMRRMRAKVAGKPAEGSELKKETPAPVVKKKVVKKVVEQPVVEEEVEVEEEE